MLDGEGRDPLVLSKIRAEERLDNQRLRPLSCHRREGAFELLRPLDHQRLHLHADARTHGLCLLEEQAVCWIATMGQESHAG